MKTKLTFLLILLISSFQTVYSQPTQDQEEKQYLKRDSVFDLIKKHKYEEALKNTNLWILEDSSISEPHYYKGYILLATNQFEESRNEYIKSISIDSNDVSSWIYYGLTYEIQNNIAKANEIYSNLLEKINRDLLKKTYMSNSFDNKYLKLTVLKLLNRDEDLQKEIEILKKDKLTKDQMKQLKEKQNESRKELLKTFFL